MRNVSDTDLQQQVYWTSGVTVTIISRHALVWFDVKAVLLLSPNINNRPPIRDCTFTRLISQRDSVGDLSAHSHSNHTTVLFSPGEFPHLSVFHYPPPPPPSVCVVLLSAELKFSPKWWMEGGGWELPHLLLSGFREGDDRRGAWIIQPAADTGHHLSATHTHTHTQLWPDMPPQQTSKGQEVRLWAWTWDKTPPW